MQLGFVLRPLFALFDTVNMVFGLVGILYIVFGLGLFTPSDTCITGRIFFFSCLHNQTVMLDKGTVHTVDLYDYIRLIVLAGSEGADVRTDSNSLLKCGIWIKNREN